MSLDARSRTVLLLTASLRSDNPDTKPLTVTEWSRFADWLVDHDLRSTDLMKSDTLAKLSKMADLIIDVPRLEALLSRGAALGFSLARWEGAGLWVMTLSDPMYPRRLKLRLGKKCPPVLYGSGNKGLLNRGGIAVVGSRDASDVDLGYSYKIGEHASNSRGPIVSGGDRGIDDAAMAGALNSNGTAVGVIAYSLLAATASKKYRQYLLSDNLVLISPFNPEAGLHTGNAMSRNKYIYCLADAAVVVTSTPGTGATWNGATENLKHRWVPLYVKSTKDEESGNPELVKMGAKLIDEDFLAIEISDDENLYKLFVIAFKKLNKKMNAQEISSSMKIPKYMVRKWVDLGVQERKIGVHWNTCAMSDKIEVDLGVQERKIGVQFKPSVRFYPRDGRKTYLLSTSTMDVKTKALAPLRTALGDPTAEFRDGQWEAIDSLVNKQERLLVVQRTGWGKSLVYFMAARIFRERKRGATLIISPLLALMRNQVDAAEKLGIKAITINSENRIEWPSLIKEILNDNADAILISPERLSNDVFHDEVILPIAGKIALLVVDEAHCISDWGHDFRPDYMQLVNKLRHMPSNLAILGTTATANNRVTEDVQNQLGNVKIQRGPLMRASLQLQTMRLPSKAERLAWLSDNLDTNSGTLPGTGIIYALTIRDVNQITEWLQKNGISALGYYAAIADRKGLEKKLLENKIKVLVATTALGMGYDKPDIGFVVHFNAPSSIIGYYQQVGRAGRNINSALGILIFGSDDYEIHKFFRDNAFPKEKWVRMVLNSLASSDGLTIDQLEMVVNLNKKQIEKVLKFLKSEPYPPVMKLGAKWLLSTKCFSMDHAKIARLAYRRVSEWQEVHNYINEKGCLMKFLADSLDDPNPEACGKCSSCLGRPLINDYPRKSTIKAAYRFLFSCEIFLECNKITAHAFPKYNFGEDLRKAPLAKTGRALSLWNDSGWGRQVMGGKNRGEFGDDLVVAAFMMIMNRWQPSPELKWITCIPSHKHPHLVPNYAQRLAMKLSNHLKRKLPFVPVIEKINSNEEQKLQVGILNQCKNLDGVFKIKVPVPDGPVLLVDDVTDSGWTLTVAAALLCQAGVKTVFPMALTSSKPGV